MYSFGSPAFRKSIQEKVWIFCLSVLLLLPCWMLSTNPVYATGVYELPIIAAGEPTWVLDEAEVLSRSNQGTLDGKLAQLANSTGQEVRFVTIHRLDYGETIESFTNDLFTKWFPDSKDQAKQTLLVLDTLTNNAAIRTGEAVKSLLPDEVSESVVKETLMVPLRNGDRYNQAFLDASDRLIAVLSGEADPGPPTVEDAIQVEGTFATPEETASSNATVWVIVLLLAATVIPMATYYFYVK